MGLLIALHVKRKETPINLILLAAFTVVEAYTVGVLVTFFDQAVVVQAFFLTAAVVVGLTAFTFQTKRDFSNIGAALYTGHPCPHPWRIHEYLHWKRVDRDSNGSGGSSSLFPLYHLRHPDDYDPSECRGVHCGHHPALPRHHQPLHRDPQDP